MLKLSEALAKKYEPLVTQPVHIFRGRKIDLRTLTLKEAEELVKEGFDLLKPIEKKGKVE